jgi:pimeloyl-ACP methyl ester carboxylesterase
VKWRFVLFSVLAGVALFAAGWWFGSRGSPLEVPTDSMTTQDRHTIDQLERSLTEKEHQIADLQGHLSSAMRDLEEQGQIIREHSLTKTVRSVHELLALFPAKFPQGNWTPAETIFEDCWFETVDGLRIHGWYLAHQQPKVVILFSHGNAGNITHRAAMAAYLHKRFDASILLFDHRGYGRSEGTPTVEGLVRDARAARDYLALRERIPMEDIVLMGRSLGGAVAVQLAADGGARALVLESTFSSLKDVAVSHYPKLLVNLLVAERLDSRSVISQFKCPVLISHGNADKTIPIALGRELFDAANEPKTFVEITGGDHNDPQSEEYYDQLERFLAGLPDR